MQNHLMDLVEKTSMKESVPKFERNAQGQDVWSLEGEHFYTVGVTAFAGWRDVFPNSPATLDECHPASYDAAALLSSATMCSRPV